jgi:glycosyltransferase involved in cell wall biosynthesis
MNSKSKISIVMSAKDAQRTITDSINSILLQSFNNFELLIMDDASTDNTAEIISQFAAKDSRVKIFTNKINLGLTASLNILIKNSSGEFIARQDSDDVSFPERLKNQMDYIYLKNLDGCTTKAVSIQDGKIIHSKSTLVPNKLLLKFKNPFIHGSLLIRKEVMNEINNYNEDFYYSQDYKLFTDLIKSGYKIKILNKILYSLNTVDNISTLNRAQQDYFANCVRKNIKPNQVY